MTDQATPIPGKTLVALWAVINGARTVRAVAKAMGGVSVNTAQRHLHDLEALKLVTVGRFPEGHHSAGYWIPGTIRPAVKVIEINTLEEQR